jgi:hypothetical protein
MEYKNCPVEQNKYDMYLKQLNLHDPIYIKM